MKELRMKSHNSPGTLISFCGLDGCGKSTMIKMLQKRVGEIGKKVVLTRQPSDMVRKSDIFRRYMDCEDHSEYEYRSLSLFAAADRIQHSNKVILPALEEGNVVISDRYFYSCLANLRARGYEEDGWIYEVSEAIPRPDIAIFLNVSPHIAISRVRRRPDERERYIDVALQYKLAAEYRNICAVNGGVLIDSSIEIEKTFEKIWDCVEKIIEEKDEKNRRKGNGNN